MKIKFLLTLFALAMCTGLEPAAAKRTAEEQQNLNEQLFEAVRKDTAETVEKLIKKGANINARDVIDWTPLHQASLLNRPNIIKTLLAHGADVEAHDINNRRALHVAARYNKHDAIKALLYHGAYIPDNLIPSEIANLNKAIKEMNQQIMNIQAFMALQDQPILPIIDLLQAELDIKQYPLVEEVYAQRKLQRTGKAMLDRKKLADKQKPTQRLAKVQDRTQPGDHPFAPWTKEL